MKTVVFLETNFSGLDAIEYCNSKGYYSVLVTDSFERFKKWFPEESLSKLELVDKTIHVSDSSDINVVINELGKNIDNMDCILTFAEIRVHTVAMINKELGLKGSNPHAIEIAQDKYRFRKLLEQKNVDNVSVNKYEDYLELLDRKHEINYPCFLKPLRGHSSMGSAVCHDESDLVRASEKYIHISDDWISKNIVAEDYLKGHLISVESLTFDKGEHVLVGISDRDVINDCVEVGASFPLKNIDIERIKTLVFKTLDAIGYDFGPSHVELIMTDTGPHLVEVNCRVGGSGHSIMMELATHRSIVGDYVELSLGRLEKDIDLYTPKEGAAWHCFVTNKDGVLKTLPSNDSVRNLNGVTHVWFHKPLETKVNGIESNFSWIVQVMCNGKNQVQAKENAVNAIRYIEQNSQIAALTE